MYPLFMISQIQMRSARHSCIIGAVLLLAATCPGLDLAEFPQLKAGLAPQDIRLPGYTIGKLLKRHMGPNDPGLYQHATAKKVGASDDSSVVLRFHNGALNEVSLSWKAADRTWIDDFARYRQQFGEPTSYTTSVKPEDVGKTKTAQYFETYQNGAFTQLVATSEEFPPGSNRLFVTIHRSYRLP